MTADSEGQIRELLETRTRAFGRRDAATAAVATRADRARAARVGLTFWEAAGVR